MPELTSLPGLFGRIEVVDSFPWRKVFACGKLQGSLSLVPPADRSYPDCAPGPGPVTDISYQLAWLMAGANHPRGVGLMLGLGAGSGAVALLHHFPHLSLRVVEIDPAMIAAARDYFPLVGYFERNGRLEIIQQEATEHLQETTAAYDFVLVDIAIDGGAAQHPILSSSFCESVTRVSDEIWINALASRDSLFLKRLTGRYPALTTLFSSEALDAWLPIQRNWIATNARLENGSLPILTPYSTLPDECADRARRRYAALLTNRIPVRE